MPDFQADGQVIRVRNVARRQLFPPEDSGIPVQLDQLQDYRRSKVIYGAEMRDHVLTDAIGHNWRQDPLRELVAEWVGETIFLIKADANNMSSAPVASGQPVLDLAPRLNFLQYQKMILMNRAISSSSASQLPLPPQGSAMSPVQVEPEPSPAMTSQRPPTPFANAMRSPGRLDGLRTSAGYGPQRNRSQHGEPQVFSGSYVTGPWGDLF